MRFKCTGLRIECLLHGLRSEAVMEDESKTVKFFSILNILDISTYCYLQCGWSVYYKTFIVHSL